MMQAKAVTTSFHEQKQSLAGPACVPQCINVSALHMLSTRVYFMVYPPSHSWRLLPSKDSSGSEFASLEKHRTKVSVGFLRLSWGIWVGCGRALWRAIQVQVHRVMPWALALSRRNTPGAAYLPCAVP